MTARILLFLTLLESVPAAAQRRSGNPWPTAAPLVLPVTRPQHGAAAPSPTDSVRRALHPVMGGLLGAVVGAAAGVGYSRAVCARSYCEGLHEPLMFCLGALGGGALGYILARGKTRSSERPRPVVRPPPPFPG